MTVCRGEGPLPGAQLACGRCGLETGALRADPTLMEPGALICRGCEAISKRKMHRRRRHMLLRWPFWWGFIQISVIVYGAGLLIWMWWWVATHHWD